jgi:hypothetical protein
VPAGEALVLRRRRRHAVQCLVLEAAATLLVASAAGVLVGTGPVDYRAYSSLTAAAAGIMTVFLVPLFVLRLTLARRITVVLTRDGIDSGLQRIAWSDVVSVHTVRQPAGRRVQLQRRGGPAVWLYAPMGSRWLPDPAFQREVAAFRQWAARHGAGVEDGGPDRRWPAVAGGLVVLAVLAAAGIRAAGRGVIWPWMPTASRVSAACPALQAAGLDRVWPADTRTLERDEDDRLDLGEYTYCSWVSRPGRRHDAPYLRLSAVVRGHDAFWPYSPIAMAATSYHADLAAASSPQPLPGLADEAFISTADDDVLIAARRANVTVSIDVDLDPRHPHEAQTTARTTARTLTAAILDDIRLGEENEAVTRPAIVVARPAPARTRPATRLDVPAWPDSRPVSAVDTAGTGGRP